MKISSKLITLDEIEMLRKPLDQLHEYHNHKSKYFSGSYPRITFEERIEEYKNNSKDGEYRIELLMEAQTNNIIAFCITHCKKLIGKVDVLFVDETYRGNGLGKELMHHAMKWFKEKDINEIELTVVYGNEAVAFYQKFGFFPRSIIMTTKS
ncbi:GNAT family N-acetyltransferase [Bacillus sp. BRMEA1]|uniref:GNAT family N-acetyltransferase n=1 Tax=Neobacillus endophyticus TaxID=2738405 RepID=UPI001565913F|nr:GNAT family N-acetyltransferase [Neobacillus endophyticus]NRD77047.1 GNAT family N-acetyltransferase [Neobacillus endophyticus]